MTRANAFPAGKQEEPRFPAGAAASGALAHTRYPRADREGPRAVGSEVSVENAPADALSMADTRALETSPTSESTPSRDEEAEQPERLPFLDRRPSTVEELDTDALLMRAEVSRMRFLALFVFFVAPIGLITLHYAPFQTGAADIHRVGIVLALSVAIWFYRRVRTVADYTTGKALVLGHACVLGLASGFYHWGMFSAVLMLIPFAGLLVNQSKSRLLAFSVSGSAVVLYSVMALLQVTGVVGENGLTRGATGEPVAQLIGFAAVLGVMISCSIVTRLFSVATRRLLRERDEALAELGHREAQLFEAREELAMARHVRAPGRYTDRQIGDYTLGEVIGRGAMSEVYEAIHKTSGASAAVKLLHPHVLATPEHFRRFVREARIVAALEEPHIVRVLGVSRGSETLPYIAMELLQGETLARYLKRIPQLPLAAVVDLVRQIGRGLAAAHAAGVVHRDLKPHNLYRTEDAAGRAIWKILDFGVCKLVEPHAHETQLGRLIGTPAYMAPEQARGRPVDARTDMYGLGVVAYRSLTGRPAFAGREVDRVLCDVVFRHPPRPSDVCGVPSQLDLAFALALAKRPEHRFETGEAFADALVAAACGELPPKLCKLGERLLARAASRDLTGAECVPVALADDAESQPDVRSANITTTRPFGLSPL